MIPVTTRKDQTIALFGLGGSGLVTAQALMEGGAKVVAFDDNPKSVEKAAAEGVSCQDLREVDFSKVDALVLAPGVPLTHPAPHWSVDLAKAHDVEITGDVALFADELRAHAPDSPFIAITGTNGKSTTTALISHVLAHNGMDVQMGGNIGKAVLSLEPSSGDRVHVVECSSYQIDLAPRLDPQIGILLNLAPDHLDRHGTMENYANIKKRLVEASDIPILGVDDDFTTGIELDLRRTGKNPIAIRASDSSVDLNGIATLRGSHNAQNANAAYATCLKIGLSSEQIHNGFKTFPGLAHRMEILGEVSGVSYVNDSKATNADAAAMALASFSNIHWIAGGLAKEGGIQSLHELFGNVSKAYLIGEAAPEFAVTLGSDLPFEISETIDAAVASAAGQSGKGDVVLLSPACASFDQFANFEIRGEAFRAAVHELEGFTKYGEKTT